MPARAIGTATVSFGLVSIPVKVYSSNEPSQSISFNMLHGKCGSRLKQQYICPHDEEVVPRSDIVKGYEYAKGQYVTFSEDELKAVEAVSTKAIEIIEFVPADKVPPVHFDKTYYLGTDKGGEKAYALLAEAMRQSGRAGLARYAAHGNQNLVLVRPWGDGLMMHQLRYADEIKPFSEVPMGEAPPINPAELKLAMQIVDHIATEDFHAERYKDDVKEAVLQLIQKKVEGQEITAAPEAPQAQIIDLMEALKASLNLPKPSHEAAGDEAAPAAAAERKPPRRASRPRAAADGEGKRARSSRSSRK